MDRSLSLSVDTPERVRMGFRISYALPALALAVVGIPVYVYMPKFYTDVIGLSAATAGSVLLAVRLFDAISDPLCGWISDHSRTPLGRRRPYILLGSVPLAASLLGVVPSPRMDRRRAALVVFDSRVCRVSFLDSGGSSL